MKLTRWAIVGPGEIAKQFTRDLQWSKYPNEVIAVVGHNTDSTDEFAKEFRISRKYDHIAGLIEAKEVDVVYIATPHPQHYEIVKACLENKIPVLCEKPLVLNAVQGRSLIDLSVTTKTFLMEAMWLRFLPSIQQVLKFIEEGKIGNVVSIRATITFKAPENDDNRYFDPAKGGGSLLDLGVYAVFLSVLLLGKPPVIKAVGKLTDQGIDESAALLFQYANGEYAMLDSSLGVETHFPAEITGDKGIIKILDPWYEKATGIEVTVFNEGSIIYPCKWQGHGLYFEVDEVVEKLTENKIESDLMPHKLSLTILEVMDYIRQQIGINYEKYE